MKFCWGALLLLLISCKKEFPNVQTKVFGHGGESIHKSKSKYSPNTLRSIERAFELGAEGVEIDVQMTNDNILVAYHDGHLEDNSTGSGCIFSQSFQDINTLEIYKSSDKIEELNELLDFTILQGKQVMLDIKQYNFCTEEKINFNALNDALNSIILGYSVQQKEQITVNCRDLDLLTALTDFDIKKSLESDDLNYALPLIQFYDLDMMTIKLSEINQASKDSLTAKGIGLSIYNVKTRGDIYKALGFDPEYVISDNIKCTLKAING